jgi:hypothetical protein
MRKFLLCTLFLAIATCSSSIYLVSDADASTFTPGYSAVGTPNPAVYLFTGTGANVVATFVGGSAADTDILEMSVNGGAFVASTLNNQTSSSGDTFSFGTVSAGATIVFAILNQSTGTTLTSNAALNADHDQHVWSFSYTKGTLGFSAINSGTALAFEDLLGGPSQNSDFDYNDFEAVVTGIDPLTTPLPAALPLFATGLGAMGLFGWRRKRKAADIVA